MAKKARVETKKPKEKMIRTTMQVPERLVIEIQKIVAVRRINDYNAWCEGGELYVDKYSPTPRLHLSAALVDVEKIKPEHRAPIEQLISILESGQQKKIDGVTLMLDSVMKSDV